MRTILRIVWPLNIILCVFLAFIGEDIGDNTLQAGLWAMVWTYAELFWASEKRGGK